MEFLSSLFMCTGIIKTNGLRDSLFKQRVFVSLKLTLFSSAHGCQQWNKGTCWGRSWGSSSRWTLLESTALSSHRSRGHGPGECCWVPRDMSWVVWGDSCHLPCLLCPSQLRICPQSLWQHQSEKSASPRQRHTHGPEHSETNQGWNEWQERNDHEKVKQVWDGMGIRMWETPFWVRLMASTRGAEERVMGKQGWKPCTSDYPSTLLGTPHSGNSHRMGGGWTKTR